MPYADKISLHEVKIIPAKRQNKIKLRKFSALLSLELKIPTLVCINSVQNIKIYPKFGSFSAIQHKILIIFMFCIAIFTIKATKNCL